MSQQRYPQDPQYQQQYPSQPVPPESQAQQQSQQPPQVQQPPPQAQQQPPQAQRAQQAQQPPQVQHEEAEAIWDSARADEFRQRWHEIQTHFVEDPQGSVAEARQVVGDAVRSLADNVHEREEQLARRGARASDSTEGMRDTVLQYHRLLEQVLSV